MPRFGHVAVQVQVVCIEFDWAEGCNNARSTDLAYRAEVAEPGVQLGGAGRDLATCDAIAHSAHVDTAKPTPRLARQTRISTRPLALKKRGGR